MSVSVISPHSEIPMYRQVAGILRARIAQGEYPPNYELRAEEDLAFDFTCSKDTIRDAIGLLVGEGLLDKRQGRRTRVREPIVRQYIPPAPGEDGISRMPTPEERAKYDIPDGVPVLVVGEDRVYPADRWRFRMSGEQPEAE